jgi:hypothetical protein
MLIHWQNSYAPHSKLHTAALKRKAVELVNSKNPPCISQLLFRCFTQINVTMQDKSTHLSAQTSDTEGMLQLLHTLIGPLMTQ